MEMAKFDPIVVRKPLEQISMTLVEISKSKSNLVSGR